VRKRAASPPFDVSTANSALERRSNLSGMEDPEVLLDGLEPDDQVYHILLPCIQVRPTSAYPRGAEGIEQGFCSRRNNING